MAHDVFVSYAHQDRTVANAVCATLEAHGIRCWIAPRDILPGSDWGEAIIDALQEAKAMVLVFSSGSNESDQIKREVERAVHQGIAVVPFRIEDVLPNKTLEYFISTQHWLDALTPPLEDHLNHLAETITVLLAKKGAQRETPAPWRRRACTLSTAQPAGGDAPARAPAGHHGRRPPPAISLGLGVRARRVSGGVGGSRRGLVAMVAAGGGHKAVPAPPTSRPSATAEAPANLSASRILRPGERG